MTSRTFIEVDYWNNNIEERELRKTMSANRLGRNIQHLRTMYGETLEGLGNEIHIAKSTVKGYENGSRKPDPDMLLLIANHYNKTVDELLNSNLTDLESIKNKLSVSKVIDYFCLIMPLFTSEEAMKNSSFKKAYDMTQRLLKAFSKGEILRGSIIVDIFELYINSIEKAELAEGVANAIWTIFIWWSQLTDVNVALALQRTFFANKEFEVKELDNFRKNVSNKVLEKRRGFLTDIDEIFVELIKVLKTDLNWADLGDYYSAMRYVQAMVDNGLSDNMNIAIGMQMMITYAKIENPYAVKFLVNTKGIE